MSRGGGFQRAVNPLALLIIEFPKPLKLPRNRRI